MVPSRVTKRQRSGSKSLVSVSDRDVVRLQGLSKLSMESCRVACRATNGDTTDVPTDVEVLSINVPEMDSVVLLLEKDTD